MVANEGLPHVAEHDAVGTAQRPFHSPMLAALAQLRVLPSTLDKTRYWGIV